MLLTDLELEWNKGDHTVAIVVGHKVLAFVNDVCVCGDEVSRRRCRRPRRGRDGGYDTGDRGDDDDDDGGKRPPTKRPRRASKPRTISAAAKTCSMMIPRCLCGREAVMFMMTMMTTMTKRPLIQYHPNSQRA